MCIYCICVYRYILYINVYIFGDLFLSLVQKATRRLRLNLLFCSDSSSAPDQQPVFVSAQKAAATRCSSPQRLLTQRSRRKRSGGNRRTKPAND